VVSKSASKTNKRKLIDALQELLNQQPRPEHWKSFFEEITKPKAIGVLPFLQRAT
jgi:hypothetical protein